MGAEFDFGVRYPNEHPLHPLAPTVLYADPSHVILVNAALPLDPAAPAHASTAYILSYSLQTGQFTELGALRQANGDVKSVSLHENGTCLTIVRHHSGSDISESLRRDGDNWRGGEACRSEVANEQLDVAVVEGLNEPPRLVARGNGREIVLRGPEERFRSVEIAPIREITWTEAHGRRETGGLTLPIGHGDGPFPLVILSTDFFQGRFLPDGAYPQFGAQLFAEAGIAVLQFSTIEPPNGRDTLAEGPALVDRVDSAVSTLVAQGLVDPAHVGIFGFSRGGFTARYVSVFPGRIRPAAALADDAYAASYVNLLGSMETGDANYIAWAAGPVGGRPFWQDKENWLAHSPNFNLERLRTPFLIVERGIAPATYIGHQETRAAARSIHAPFEHVTFPTATHQPHRPREREAFIRLSLDWFRFWLQDYEDPSPEKAEMYQRWRTMRSNLAALPPVDPAPHD
jgi:hypothetical protein